MDIIPALALEPVSVKSIGDKLDEEFPVDNAVFLALPPDVKFISAKPFGSSAWTLTAKVLTEKEDGTNPVFFLKIAYGELGSVMLNGEYESSKIISDIMPGLIPEPVGFGRYYTTANPATHFYLSEFVDMDTDAVPCPLELGEKLAELHRKSQTRADKFGFHVVTCDGKMPHTVDWQDSWAVFFGRLLAGICKIDREVNGSWPEFELATEQIITKVVPRLLGDLKSDGQPIQPSILHGDLWEPNLGVRKQNGRLIMFDVGSYWAHNEMDLGLWRADFCDHFRKDLKTYTKAYLEHFPAAEPVEEFDDRNRLYSLKASINYSAGHPGSVVRQSAYNNMCYLCAKYAAIGGIDEYDPQKDPSVTGIGFSPDFTKRD